MDVRARGYVVNHCHESFRKGGNGWAVHHSEMGQGCQKKDGALFQVCNAGDRPICPAGLFYQLNSKRF